MLSTKKSFLTSKKCTAYLILMVASTGLIAMAIVMGQSAETVQKLVSSYGIAITGASLALISGQSYIDSKTPSAAETETEPTPEKAADK